MKNLVIAFVFCFVGTLVVSCIPAATDDEIGRMCENLVGLRADGPLPVEKDLLARVEEDFKAREKKLVDWRAKDLKGWDDELAAKLEKLGLTDVLIVTAEFEENLALASRNLHWTTYIEANQINPVSLVAFDKILITVPALKRVEERLG